MKHINVKYKDGSERVHVINDEFEAWKDNDDNFFCQGEDITESEFNRIVPILCGGQKYITFDFTRASNSKEEKLCGKGEITIPISKTKSLTHFQEDSDTGEGGEMKYCILVGDEDCDADASIFFHLDETTYKRLKHALNDVKEVSKNKWDKDISAFDGLEP